MGDHDSPKDRDLRITKAELGDFGGSADGHVGYGADSIAVGQPSYELFSTPLPVEPLAPSSPTTAYHSFALGTERVLRARSSRSHLISSQRSSLSSSHHFPSHHTGYGQDQRRDYRELDELQPSTSPAATQTTNELKMNPFTQFTPSQAEEQPSSPTRTRLIEYGLHDKSGKKTLKFWTLILAFAITVMLTALDMTMISTALPSIVEDLPASTVAGGWVTSSYLLTVTAFQPLFGGLSCVIGRRWSAVLAVLLFVGGSILCGSANSLLFLVIGRGVQGLGGGGIQAIGEITVSDITTLRERGFFVGIFGLVFAVASFVAPVLGGYFSDHDWRWIFWINIPIGTVALVMLVPTTNLPVPSMPLKTKLAKMDIVGNLVLLGSVVGILIAVTEGGVSYPWSSVYIWAPLTAGLAGFLLFLVIEFVPNPLSTQPVLPLKLFSNRTACSAFLMTFLHGVATYGAIYALPIYFQAIKDEQPLRSAVSTFPSTAPSAPFAIVAGIIMAVTGKYRDLTYVGWAFAAGGFGWMTRFEVGTPEWELITAQIVGGIGIGILFAITLPPIQASLPIDELETATATYAFCRSFGAIWGIAITTSVLTAEVSKKLATVPQAAQFGLTGPTALGYVENIKHLPEPLRDQVRQVYADGLQRGMYAFLPVVIVGFACCFWMKELPLPDYIREEEESEKRRDRHEQPAMSLHQPEHARRAQSGVSRQTSCQHSCEEQPTTLLLDDSPDSTLVDSTGVHQCHPNTLDAAIAAAACDILHYRKDERAATQLEAYASDAYHSSPPSSPILRAEAFAADMEMNDRGRADEGRYGRIATPSKAYWQGETHF
ncbi:Major facilitator superfamily [Kalmanozyma brasiliensis GHG001]|uniref:Major facilitator superfamily n=1 Tax=Kalmanozyma brasiliensis (strain GHG001) TaxID=1365824 RepID=UPI002867DE21|nr:Major facilitator superfamily [Kalmanozyma brasiliensis GHG001]KAF6767500.1 Major facilitator superfamily [Kalmanozyma brasiliensis GHG001]